MSICITAVFCQLIDYLPLQFILPNAYDDIITINIREDKPVPPLCAVVSPTVLEMSVDNTFWGQMGTKVPISSGGYLHAIVHDPDTADLSSYADDEDIDCCAKTLWDTYTIRYHIHAEGEYNIIVTYSAPPPTTLLLHSRRWGWLHNMILLSRV